MNTTRGAKVGLAVLAVLGGCRQLIGYEDPIVVKITITIK